MYSTDTGNCKMFMLSLMLCYTDYDLEILQAKEVIKAISPEYDCGFTVTKLKDLSIIS